MRIYFPPWWQQSFKFEQETIDFFVSIEDNINYLDEYFMVIRDKNKRKPPN